MIKPLSVEKMDQRYIQRTCQQGKKNTGAIDSF
jgi:hypothetical protein